MPNTTTLGENTLVPLTGTEWVRLATPGFNWKAQTQNWPIGIGTAPTIGGTTTEFLWDNAGTIAETSGMTWDSVNKAITLTGYAKLSSLQLIYNALQVTGAGAIWIDNSANMFFGQAGTNRLMFGGLDLGGTYNFWGGGSVFQWNGVINGAAIVSIVGGNTVTGDIYGIDVAAPSTGNLYFRCNQQHSGGAAVFVHLLPAGATGGLAQSQYNINGGQEWGSGLKASDGAFYIASDLTFSTFDFKITSTGSVITNDVALATTATNGFLYIPTCAGAPTGAPTAQTGTVAIVYDTTDHKLYIYDTNGNTWRGGTVPGVWS
jgi:hypothetical protein